MDSSVRYHSALTRYLEDFAVGQKFGSATLRVEEERVKRFAVLARPFSVAADELTVSLKMRRNVIFQHHKEELEALYRE